MSEPAQDKRPAQTQTPAPQPFAAPAKTPTPAASATPPPVPTASPVAQNPSPAASPKWSIWNPFAGMFGDTGKPGPGAAPSPAPTATPTPAGPQTGPSPTTTGPGQNQAPATAQTGQNATAPNGQPAAQPAAPKAPDPKEISQLAADIRKETDGHWFASPASTLQILRGRTPEEIAAIKAEYKSHYGTDLDSSLGGSLSGKDKAEYQALISQDSKDPASKAKAAIAGLQNAEKDNFLGIGGQHADKAAVEKIFKGMDPATRAELQKQGFNVDGYLQKYYSGDELKKVQAQATGDKASEMAADLKMATHSGWFGASTDKNKILDTLASCKTEEERKA
ncbi:MAG TPA: hypothetical protein PKW11_12575, partial [Pseudomonadota bacterium]|nr:hypothetical protein [Pseudomonadota bacterium]